MNITPLVPVSAPVEELLADYQSGWQVGKLRVGQSHLFFREGGETVCVPYSAVRYCYRRIEATPARLCCGAGNLETEYLMLVGEDGQLAKIQVPDGRAGKVLLERLRPLIPHAQFHKPEDAPADD